jgi:hypothetical protein
MNVDAEKIGASLLALFAGQSGRQKSEIHFDPATP